MAADDSIHEQLAEAIRISLGEIAASDDYHYTPGLVTRASWDQAEPPLLDPSIVGPIYALRPAEEDHREGSTQVVDALAGMAILVAHRYEGPDPPQDPASPRRATVVNRMVRDVLRKLLADVQLGAFSVGQAVENIFDGSVIVDRDRFLEGWALAEIAFTSKYRYVGGVP